MFRSCVSLKLAVTQTSSRSTSAISGWPGCDDLARLDRLAADDAVSPAPDDRVFEIQLAPARAPRPPASRARRRRRLRPRRLHLLRRGVRRLSDGLRLRGAGPRLACARTRRPR